MIEYYLLMERMVMQITPWMLKQIQRGENIFHIVLEIFPVICNLGSILEIKVLMALEFILDLDLQC